MPTDSTPLGGEAQQVFEAAMKLPERERAKLANRLALTVDPPANPQWQASWGRELALRIAEVESGTAKLHDWEDVRRRLWEGLDAPAVGSV